MPLFSRIKFMQISCIETEKCTSVDPTSRPLIFIRCVKLDRFHCAVNIGKEYLYSPALVVHTMTCRRSWVLQSSF